MDELLKFIDGVCVDVGDWYSLGRDEQKMFILFVNLEGDGWVVDGCWSMVDVSNDISACYLVCCLMCKDRNAFI